MRLGVHEVESGQALAEDRALVSKTIAYMPVWFQCGMKVGELRGHRVDAWYEYRKRWPMVCMQ